MIHCLLLESTVDIVEKSTLNNDDQNKEIELSSSYTNEGDEIISSFTTIIPKVIKY